MARNHYMLAARPDGDDQWSNEFQNEYRDVVEQERQMFLTRGWKVRELRIIPFQISGDEPTIGEAERALERLNTLGVISNDARC